MDRLTGFLDVASDWRRPLPADWLRRDALVAAGAFAFAALALELARSMGAFDGSPTRVATQYVLVASASALLLVRRRLPAATGLAATAHLLVTSTVAPTVAVQLVCQLVYFVGVYSAVAWARNRTVLAAAAVCVAVTMVLWSLWYFALGQGLDAIAEIGGAPGHERTGLFPAVPATLVYFALNNIVFFVGAAVLGAAGWRSARRRAVTEEQAATIAAQAEELSERAVVDERLRIARELHDVAAHHVASIGVQAAAARKVMGRDPERAAGALREVEAASRSAVGEMRSLLGALRTGESTAEEPAAGRQPEPGLGALPALVEEASTGGFRATLELVPDPDTPLEAVPPGVGHSLYRTVQEALANVRRHSTADSARVTVRTGAGDARWAEVEVVDDGRPRAGTSGSGVGLLGMRERVASHRGSCEIGPRATGGFRVRVRLPLQEER